MEYLIIGALVFLVIIYCACKVSGYCSRKEEQEEAIRRIEGKEYMLDEYNIEDDFTYDETFVKKEDGTNEKSNN